ncbi:MAG TPA: bifunctional hydroxymethylpyrimidine kinase/phosphomethylpyrimidine kinase [Candidatus Binataceae bacterium]|nr:bifunctional hydroxymethylpyrimidine kinase/phosphomethylpyrimidine kinase [Candidatus Binataceae bacterium]
MTTKRKIPVAMTIAGSDPGGGAGLQADLKTFAACKVYGFSAVTAITAQNSARVSRVVAIAPELLREQIVTLVEERIPDALKTGALGNAANARVVAEAIRDLKLPAPVIDPVMVSTSGARLLDVAGERALRDQLIPLARVVTPNIPEAELLAGVTIDGPEGMKAAARAIHKGGARAVIIKGGHSQDKRAVDLLFDGRDLIELSSLRLSGDGAHGTGCAFSAAIAANLAKGADLEAAARRAKAFITRALRGRFTLGAGRPVLDHFARG